MVLTNLCFLKLPSNVAEMCVTGVSTQSVGNRTK